MIDAGYLSRDNGPDPLIDPEEPDEPLTTGRTVYPELAPEALARGEEGQA